jgi:hypothetical protein
VCFDYRSYIDVGETTDRLPRSGFVQRVSSPDKNRDAVFVRCSVLLCDLFRIVYN